MSNDYNIIRTTAETRGHIEKWSIVFKIPAVSVQVDIEKKSNHAILKSINDQPIRAEDLRTNWLWQVLNCLQAQGFRYVSVSVNEETYPFPTYDTLSLLPEVHGQTKILCTLDYYDGPISGILEIDGQFYHFDWCMETVNVEWPEPGRCFSLRHLAATAPAHIEKWIHTYNKIVQEMRLVNNPHIYPISDWQKSQMPTEAEYSARLDQHLQIQPDFYQLPITAWMMENAQEFAPIRTVMLTDADSKYLEQWQKDVADALVAEDQIHLDQLFSKPPVLHTAMDLYVIQKKDASGNRQWIIRDHRGQPVPADFWLSVDHIVQNFSGLINAN